MTAAKDRFCWDYSGATARRGVALILTIVILVVLSTICYTLTARLSMVRRRQEYMVNYQKSRYACDSAVKFALTAINQIPLNLVTRKGEPDFSDIFNMGHDEYKVFLEEWAARKAAEEAAETDSGEDLSAIADALGDLLKAISKGEPNDPNNQDIYDAFDSADANTIEVPGPYGAEWPLVHAPIELEIGDTRVVIRIEDENAKMPLIWAMTTDASRNRQAEAAFETFCEWMQMESSEIDELKRQVGELSRHKKFTLDLKPVTYTEQTEVVNRAAPTSRNVQTPQATISRTTTRTMQVTRPAIAHTTDFAKLLHSSVLDTDRLALPLPDKGDRYEAPLRYLALWGSQRVNINTAPRHVLEAAFTFGGDARAIAHDIILARQEKPFKDLDELKSRLYRYNDSIRKVEPYIATRSTFFAVKVTATTGSARASAVATVVREGTNVQRIAVLSF
jgi:hypothetical protein